MSQWAEKCRITEGKRRNLDMKANIGLDCMVCGKGMWLSSMTLSGDIFSGLRKSPYIMKGFFRAFV